LLFAVGGGTISTKAFHYKNNLEKIIWDKRQKHKGFVRNCLPKDVKIVSEGSDKRLG
jgi:hypothetical protein